MIVTFFDREHDGSELDGTIIRSVEQLRQLLESLANRAPFFCELVGDNGYDLLIGIGPRGCAQYSRSDGEPPYLVAVAPNANEQGQEAEVEFVMGGTATPVSTRNCMPFHYVRQIAGYFVETGRAHPLFAWEKI